MYSYIFYPQLFTGQFHKSVLLHFSTAAQFYNWINTLCHPHPFLELYLSILYTSQFLELYYYTYHYIFLLYHFPADTFRNVLLHFLSPPFFGPIS